MFCCKSKCSILFYALTDDRDHGKGSHLFLEGILSTICINLLTLITCTWSINYHPKKEGKKIRK